MTTLAINPAVCPICGNPNGCRLAEEDPYPEPCWCTRIPIPPHVLRHVPETAKNRACVCRICVEKYSHPLDSLPIRIVEKVQS